MPSIDSKSDSAVRIIDIIKREGVAEIIIYMCEHGNARYSDLKNLLDSESTLIRALKILVEEGILTRRVLDEKYRPTQYIITEKGEQVGAHLKALIEVH